MTTDLSTLPTALRARLRRVAACRGLPLAALLDAADTQAPAFTAADLERADEDLLHVDVRAC